MNRRARLLAALLFAASACTRPEPVLEPVQRLERELSPAARGKLDCEIGGELRPSIGCVWPQPLQNQRRIVGADGRVRFGLPIPPLQSPHPRLLEIRCWRPGEIEDLESSVFLVPGNQSQLEIDHVITIQKPGEEVVVAALLYNLSSTGSREMTRAMPIRKGSALDVGIGLAPIAVRAGASPAEFKLLAVDDAGTHHEILRRTITPQESNVWRDERIDLERFAGKRIQFVFETAIRPAAGSDPTQTFTLGLWGGAKLLESRQLEGRYDLILISLDTLRADVVGSEVDGEPVTPKLDAIAAEGSSFTDVMTTYPSTSAAHMSMFTGLFPKVHGVTFPTQVLPTTISTLPQMLASHGFTTAAVTEGGMLSAISGFRRGFDFYREFSGEEVWKSPRQVERTFAAGLEWVKQHLDERFFLFLHTYQVHNPYTPPPEFVQRHDDEGGVPRSPGRALYEAEVSYTDSEIGALMERLDQAGALDHAIVVFTSDHGEEFSEHGGIGHARTVYDEVMRVPLILWGPGVIPEGRILSEPASLVDVVPTLLDLVGVPPVTSLPGRSLVSVMQGESSDPARIRFAEGPARKSSQGTYVVARDRSHKWIARSEALAEPEIYDLGSDPGEERPLDDPALRERGAELFREFDALVDRGDKHEKPKERKLDEETESKLRALGYLE